MQSCVWCICKPLAELRILLWEICKQIQYSSGRIRKIGHFTSEECCLLPISQNEHVMHVKAERIVKSVTLSSLKLLI
jgi:hypothetical protein